MNLSLFARYETVLSRCPGKARYHVAPRYSGGSPAMVPLEIALGVADNEREFIEHALSGCLGEQSKTRADREGLKNIVYARWETGRKVHRLDLLTGEEIIEPKRLEYEEIERLRVLRHMRQYATLHSAHMQELAQLEWRAAIHRQTLCPP